MSELILPAATLFRFNSGMLSLVLEDLSQEDAVRRWKNGEGSSISYLTGHLMSSRIGLLKTLGAESENPYKELFGAGAGSRDGAAYPPVSQLKTEWDVLAETFHAALEAWHESYHIGQVGIMRTEMGYTSMRQVLYAARTGQAD
jgi:hypothetical protein